MVVVGPSKIIGLTVGGYIAAEGISLLFGCGAVLAAISLGLFAIALRVDPVKKPDVPDGDEGEDSPRADEETESGGMDMEPV